MAVNFTVEKHTVAYIGNVVASHYGEHMVALNITEPTDNGRLVKVGIMESLDLFDVEDVTAIDAYVAQKNTNGTWLVVVNEVKDPRTALVYSEPIIDYESPRVLTQLSNFYNDPADGAARGYILHSLDRFSLSEDGFVGTPTKGAKITAIQDGKPVIAG